MAKTPEYQRCQRLLKIGTPLAEAIEQVKTMGQVKTGTRRGKPKYLSPHAPKPLASSRGIDPDLVAGDDSISHDEGVHADQLLNHPSIPERVKEEIRHAMKGGTSEPPMIEREMEQVTRDMNAAMEQAIAEAGKEARHPPREPRTPADLVRVEGQLTRLCNTLEEMAGTLQSINKNLLNGRWGR